MFVESLKAGLILFEKRETIATAAKRLWRHIRKGDVRIAVFGPGGVGKSTLGEILSGSLDPSTTPRQYRESIWTEEFRLPGDVPATLLVAPGQERRRKTTWSDLFRQLSKGKSIGVINLVAYGYHAIGGEQSFKQNEVYQPGMTRLQFLKAFTERQRQSELQVLREIQPHLEAAYGRIWMLTLVTKQDLWWKNRKTVEEHYTQGEYNRIVDEIAARRGSEQFSHEFVSASLVIQNLMTNIGEELAPTTAGYDQTRRAANLLALLETVDTLVRV
ncbi:MAG: hypothetical protein ACKV2Q_06635 [Planctomycetaceae bacterium]